MNKISIIVVYVMTSVLSPLLHLVTFHNKKWVGGEPCCVAKGLSWL